jgi:hypothetical protein
VHLYLNNLRIIFVFVRDQNLSLKDLNTLCKLFFFDRLALYSLSRLKLFAFTFYSPYFSSPYQLPSVWRFSIRRLISRRMKNQNTEISGILQYFFTLVTTYPVYLTYFISSLSITATKCKFSEFDRNWLKLPSFLNFSSAGKTGDCPVDKHSTGL